MSSPRRSKHRSSSSQNIAVILRLTSERLDHESHRADTAERKAADCLARLRTALDDKYRADNDIARITEELRLYKIQLDVAQKEINRAQEIVDNLEKARIDADADAARARTIARKFQEDWAVMTAREEGRKQGYKEGLRKGRRAGFEEGRAAGYASGHYRSGSPPRILHPDRSPPRILHTVPSRPPSRSLHARVQSPPRTIPDAAPFAPAMPVPTLTTPTPSFRQPVPLSVLSPSHSPEPIHLRPHSPASTDGWIPTADENLNMDIPPPHALVNPIIAGTASSPRSTTRSIPPHPQVRSRDYAYPATQPVVPQQQPPRSPTATSTRLSELDLVSPPHQRSRPASTRSRDARVESSPTREPSQPERIAEEWRMANPDIAGSPRNGDRTAVHDAGVVIPSPVVVAQRVEMYNNAPLANKPFDRPSSPTRDLIEKNKTSHLIRGLSNASTVQIHVSSPSTSASDASPSARLAKDMLSPNYHPKPLPETTHTTDASSSPEKISVATSAEPPPGVIYPDAQPKKKPSVSSSSPRYEEAPLPPGVTYPDPPVAPDKKKEKKKKKKKKERRQDSLSGSPAPLDRPISIFSEPLE